MAEVLANEFAEILPVLAANDGLRESVLALVAAQPMAGKAMEGGERLVRFRAVLADLVNGRFGLAEAVRRSETELPRTGSIHAGSNRVFADGWAERLVRTQLSRFYNQAVMERLMADGETRCFVPHSSAEDAGSPCSRQLAGAHHDLATLHRRLVAAYGEGDFSQPVKVPNHPHCTHVVTRARP